MLLSRMRVLLADFTVRDILESSRKSNHPQFLLVINYLSSDITQREVYGLSPTPLNSDR